MYFEDAFDGILRIVLVIETQTKKYDVILPLFWADPCGLYYVRYIMFHYAVHSLSKCKTIINYVSKHNSSSNKKKKNKKKSHA